MYIDVKVKGEDRQCIYNIFTDNKRSQGISLNFTAQVHTTEFCSGFEGIQHCLHKVLTVSQRSSIRDYLMQSY